MCVCVCVHVRACVHVCVRVCARVCVYPCKCKLEVRDVLSDLMMSFHYNMKVRVMVDGTLLEEIEVNIMASISVVQWSPSLHQLCSY